MPSEVAHAEEIEIAGPLADEARVALLAAPVNPADLNVIEGKYPIRPPLPGVPGVEGAGVAFLNDPYPDGPNDYIRRVEQNIARLRRMLDAQPK